MYGKMGLFRRSMSSSSSKSHTTTSSITSASNALTARTSLDSDRDNDISESLATIKQRRTAPILTLPIELVQQITSYLDNASAASFCLSSRFVCYAVGTNHLSKYIAASKSRFEKRRTIEIVVERAFPGHWLCAWCDKFHAWNVGDGPKERSREKKRDCADFNSYLQGGPDYMLCYHHVRLAVNCATWGPEHGIPLEDLSYSRSAMAKIFKTPVPTRLLCEARVVNGHFLLRSTFSIVLPSWSMSNKNLLKHVWPTLPHILVGHRDSENGHTGLMAAIDNVVRRGWKYPFTQMCSTCATDWSISMHEFPHAASRQMRLVIQTWRDLGSGRSPFETSWRAHGVHMQGHSNLVTDIVRLTSLRPGDTERAFESTGNAEKAVIETTTRTRSTSRSPIYRSFMRRDSSEEQGDVVRRSRARPRTWRTRSENEEAQRRDEEERLDMSRNVAESLLRHDLERGRQY